MTEDGGWALARGRRAFGDEVFWGDALELHKALQRRLRTGRVDLDDPATTLALLELNAIVGALRCAEPKQRTGDLR